MNWRLTCRSDFSSRATATGLRHCSVRTQVEPPRKAELGQTWRLNDRFTKQSLPHDRALEQRVELGRISVRTASFMLWKALSKIRQELTKATLSGVWHDANLSELAHADGQTLMVQAVREPPRTGDCAVLIRLDRESSRPATPLLRRRSSVAASMPCLQLEVCFSNCSL